MKRPRAKEPRPKAVVLYFIIVSAALTGFGVLFAAFSEGSTTAKVLLFPSTGIAVLISWFISPTVYRLVLSILFQDWRPPKV